MKPSTGLSQLSFLAKDYSTFSIYIWLLFLLYKMNQTLSHILSKIKKSSIFC